MRSGVEMPTLYLVRHAKSAYPEGVEDVNRPLGDRGNRDAVQLGIELAERCESPDLVLVSVATRAQQTWEHASAALKPRAVSVVDELYFAWPDDLLQITRRTDDNVSTLFLVGHNDGFSAYASLLAGSEVVLKTASFAALEDPREWKNWSESGAKLLEVCTARA
jgi:phosphohistidine phosphatase